MADGSVAKFISLFFNIVFIFLFGACSSQEQNKLPDKVTLQLKWVHQAQFAGFYVAVEKGFYSEENLEVTLLPGGSSINQADQLQSGKADFAVIPAETLFLENDGNEKIVAISVIYQRNPTAFVSHKDSGITRPEDFIGKKIAVGNLENSGFLEGIIQLNALLPKRGLDGRSITRMPYEWDYKGFLENKVDITPAYLVGGVIQLKEKNIPINIIWPGDYGIDFYSDTLASTSRYVEQNQYVVQRFLRASLKGWQYCIAHQDEVVDIVMKYAEVKNVEMQRAMLEAQVPLVHTGVSPIGWMKKDIWQKMYQMLDDEGLITKGPQDIESVYTTKFLKEIYRGESL